MYEGNRRYLRLGIVDGFEAGPPQQIDEKFTASFVEMETSGNSM